MDKEQQTYNKVKAECDKILGSLGFSWDCLPDTNSIWDWVDGDMSEDSIKATAKDCCWDRLYDGGMDRDDATAFIYGEDCNE
tara:strand:- start:40 stop:285 length:246 start_codon:yes stop_codon:yes gene_type:complete